MKTQAVSQPLSLYEVRHNVVNYSDKYKRVGNAVYLGKGLSITVSHVLSGKNKIILDGHTAQVVLTIGGLSLLKSCCIIDKKPTKIAQLVPEDREELTHTYYWYKDKQIHTRTVSWDSTVNKCDTKFKPGMSGSGVFNSRNELVGLVELVDGTVWEVKDINHFLKEGEKAGVFKTKEEQSKERSETYTRSK
jgi:hypothetical protein